MSKCVGFGEYKGKCQNKVGEGLIVHWCLHCNKLRLDYISKQFNELDIDFNVTTQKLQTQQEESDG